MEHDTLAENWWAILLRGLVAIGFSVVAWARPHLTVAILLVLFGAYAIGDGIVAILGAMRAARREERWWTMAIEGVFGVLLGLFTFMMPMTAIAFAFVGIAIWALATGVLELIGSARLRRHIAGEWLLAMSGIVRIAFGVLLLVRPGAGLLTLLWITAGYAFVDGIVLIGLSFRLKRYFGEQRRPLGTGGMRPQPV